MPGMGMLTLIRHGQASFGAADYDQLSELGTRQCRALGQWFRGRGQRFDAVLTGTLRRHAQSLDAIADGLGDMPEALLWPGLNEYDGNALVHAVHPEPITAADRAEAVRQHFRALREGLTRWAAGELQPAGMPSWVDFVAGIEAALAHVREHHLGQQVLIVSSGGPIATAVSRVLDAPPATAIELNLHIRNSAVTEFSFTRGRHRLLSYNHLPHLDDEQRRGWASYA